MAFPSNPADGATHTIGTTQFTYNLETNQWLGAVALTTTGGSGGGGSMGAPTHYGRFTFNTNFTSAEHSGGQTYGYIGQGLTLDKTLSLKSKPQNQAQVVVDPSNYGTSIVVGGTLQDFSSAPQFCSDADYLASNPTWYASNPNNPTNTNSGSYYCSDNGGYIRYTNDRGVTFTTYIPQIQSNGTIKIITPGKYRVRVKHVCDILYSGGFNYPTIHTVIFVNDAIKVNYPDRGSWEFKSSNADNGLESRLRTEFDSIIDVTTADTEIGFGLAKIGVNSSTNNLFIVTVESLF
jgi:hypothetical protein